LSFLILGVVSPDLPAAFAFDAAYRDIVAAIPALLSLPALRTRIDQSGHSNEITARG
jgi:hypothetical protein